MRARVQATVQVSETRRRASLVMIAVLVALLLLSLFIQVWALPTEVGRWVSEYPVLEPLATPGIIWEVVAIACWQAVGLIGLRVVVLVSDHRFGASSHGWLWAMMGFLIAYFLLSIGAFVGVKVTGFWNPGLGVGLVAGAFISLLCVAYLVLFFIIRRSVRRVADRR